jgi:hypothetical protein
MFCDDVQRLLFKVADCVLSPHGCLILILYARRDRLLFSLFWTEWQSVTEWQMVCWLSCVQIDLGWI